MNRRRLPAETPPGGRFRPAGRATAGAELDPAPGPAGSATAGWPALGYEERPWRIPDTIPRSARGRINNRYQAAVVPEIADIAPPQLDGDTEGLVADASAEIARFDTEVGADIAPFASILLRTESAASSKIENLTASAKAIALAELGDPSRPDAAVIVANTHAMQSALALADRLDEGAILAMHDALLRHTRPDWCGRWRDQQVWVGGSDYGPFQAQFVPPHHQRVPAAMADLVRFLRRDDLPPLTQAALAHAQFETIHPFPDGNGLVGRALIHATLKGKGLTRRVTVPVSAGLLVDTAGYFEALGTYRDGDPAPLVRRLADASYAAIANGRQLVGELHDIRNDWDRRVKARRGAKVWATADLLLRQPVVDSALLRRELGVPTQTAGRVIGTLAGAGVVTQVSGKHRYRKWAAVEVLDALDDFAARAGRRG